MISMSEFMGAEYVGSKLHGDDPTKVQYLSDTYHTDDHSVGTMCSLPSSTGIQGNSVQRSSVQSMLDRKMDMIS